MTHLPNNETLYTLIDLIQANSGIKDRGIRYITSEQDEQFVSFQELYQKVTGLLHLLQMKAVATGTELVFQIDDQPTFLSFFWASILGGIIPVPLSVVNKDDCHLKLFNIWETLKKPRLVTNKKNLRKLEEYALANHWSAAFEKMKQQVLLVEEFEETTAGGTVICAKPGDIAYIQFTSGTTGPPKGVILTHENLMTNINSIHKATGMTPNDRVMSWMPLTHDMGLNGGHLVPILGQYNQYLMPPSLFIRHPGLWLKKASEHQISILSTSNFGIKYLLTNFNPESAKDWDLSSVRLIFNGAEPISTTLCNEFLAVMEKYHLKKTAMFTVYGMAEASLAVSFPPPGTEFISLNLARDSVSVGNTVRQATRAGDAINFVDLGYPVPDCAVRICDARNQILGEDIVGYIQIKGKNVTIGYYDQQSAGKTVFTPDGWLKTGDLGFMENGRLIVTGRVRDMIMVDGQAYYPQDIERIAGVVKGVELGETAICSISGREIPQLDIILFVLFKDQLPEFIPLAGKLKELIKTETGLELTTVLPVKKIPKTTSGKIQRYRLITDYLDGAFAGLVGEMQSLMTGVGEELLV